MILNGDELIGKVKKGVDTIADCVKVTLGPKGKNVILYNGENKAYLTKDGISVASRVYDEDPAVNAGIQIAREASEKTAKECGDSTTSTLVLTQAMFNNGLEALKSGRDIVSIREEFSDAKKIFLTELDKHKRNLEYNFDNARYISYISSNNDDYIADIVAKAYNSIDKDGTVVVENYDEPITKVETVDGSRYKIAIASKDFYSSQRKNEASYENAKVLLYNNDVKSVNEISSYLSIVASSKVPIVIFANSFSELALAQLYTNYIQGIIKVLPITTVGSSFHKRDLYIDLSMITGATICDSVTKKASDVLGNIDKVKSTLTETVLYNETPLKRYFEHIDNLQQQLDSEMAAPIKELIKQRIQQLKGKISTIYVGGTTYVEAKERYDRIEDAVCAVRCAFEEGVCDGGGSTLWRIANTMKDCPIFEKSFRETYLQLWKNSYGKIGDDFIMPISDKSMNFLTDKYENLGESGVIDPVKVVRVSVENAMSVAMQLLTTEGLVC